MVWIQSACTHKLTIVFTAVTVYGYSGHPYMSLKHTEACLQQMALCSVLKGVKASTVAICVVPTVMRNGGPVALLKARM